MYKSKLQELCHKQKWALPNYTSVKDSQDHCPLFKASVVVGGITFDSPAACKSSKQAHDEAARAAFLHFTSQPSDQKSECSCEKTRNEKEVQSSISSGEIATKQDDFKKKLQMYTRKKNLDLPKYHTEKDGVCFRARVSIGEDWFQSEGLFETTDKAENAAAQAALLSLLTDAFHENDPRSYKILLRELTEFFLPTYTTIRSDEPDFQTFSFTVEVEGKVFKGAAAKSEKLAELNAAKAAYTAIMERKLFEPGYFLPRSSGDDIHELTPCLDSIIISDSKTENLSNSTSSQKDETQEQETIGANQEIARKSESNLGTKKTSETRSYLLCNRVRVFTSIPSMALLPEGTVVLPISENKWTMVTLEFPSEKKHAI